jgi:hypothetical protein
VTLGPGVHPGVSEADYHADTLAPEPSLSCSLAQILLTRSPLHAWVAHPRLNPEHEKDSPGKFVLGLAVHAGLLGFHDHLCVIHDAEDYRTKAAKDARDAAIAAGLIPLLEHQNVLVQQIMNRVFDQLQHYEDEEISGCLWPSNPREVSVLWQEPTFGDTWCRCRPDLVTPRYLVDFKVTSAAATPEGWASRRAFELHYDLRAAWYLRGWRRAVSEAKGYRFVVVEEEFPHAMSIFEPDPETLELGERKVNQALSIWHRCLSRNDWPAYPAQIQWITPPAWAQFRGEEVLARASMQTEAQLDRNREAAEAALEGFV